MSLYEHKLREHTPRNVNLLHEAEIANQRIAVTLTRAVGTMPCAYLFVCLAIAGFPGLHASIPVYVQWFSQTFLQLVFLPVLSVGQSVLSKHQQLMAEEQFNVTEKTYHDIGQIEYHQHAQDEELSRQSKMLEDIIHTLKRRRS